MLVLSLSKRNYGRFYLSAHNTIVVVVFHLQVFQGNTNKNGIVKHSLSPDVQARFVRFYPVTFHGWPCLRVEIFVLK